MLGSRRLSKRYDLHKYKDQLVVHGKARNAITVVCLFCYLLSVSFVVLSTEIMKNVWTFG